MIVTFTGTPGVGKTKLSKSVVLELKKYYFKFKNNTCKINMPKIILINVKDFAKKYKIYDSYDNKNKCYLISEKKLNQEFKKYLKEQYLKELPLNRNSSDKKIFILKNKNQKSKSKKNQIKKIIILIDTHILFLDKNMSDLNYVVKTDLKILNKRLKQRKYSIQKIKDNLDCEIFDYCYNECLDKNYKNIIKIHNNNLNDFKKNVKSISKIIEEYYSVLV